MKYPELIIHADWGVGPNKRWYAKASLVNGSYRVHDLEAAENVSEFRNFIRREGILDRRLLVGFDFPIGLPAAYAQSAGIKSFRTFLLELGSKTWGDFFKVATSPSQISIKRPFYPHSPYGAKRNHLVVGLGVAFFENLLRRCERARPGRRNACPLFWTLGANQVGKAAINGWSEVIIPLLEDLQNRFRIWPQDGVLDNLIQDPGVIVVETYPAEFYSHLDIKLGEEGKRSQAGRRDAVDAIRNWATRTKVDVSEIGIDLDEAFGESSSGEDKFDAIVGLLGMINVIIGARPPIGNFDDPLINTVEGWILGQLTSG